VTLEGHTGNNLISLYLYNNLLLIIQVHRACFKCAICGCALHEGIRCAFDHVLYHYWGPQWFCLAHKSLGSGEKYEMLVAKYGLPKGGPAKI
jgi:hypothetical protein